jgi:hypothetical protein
MPFISPIQSQVQSMSLVEQNFITVFDSDYRFQKFIIFLVDFIHVTYDKISDTPLNNQTIKTYDQNDEISIFSFSILIHSLSMGLETGPKTK